MNRRVSVFAVVLANMFCIADTLEASASDSLLCQSIEAATAGYWVKDISRPDVVVKESSGLEKQKTASQWRIDLDLSKWQAIVTRYSGSFQQLESPQLWHVEQDPAGAGLILVPAHRAAGTSPETITITLRTLHFIYSSQHVNPLYNRANIWTGQCRPAP